MSATCDAKNKPFTKVQIKEIESFFNEKLDRSYKLRILQVPPMGSNGCWFFPLNIYYRGGGFHRRMEDIKFTVNDAQVKYSELKSKFPDSKDLAEYFSSALRSENPPYWAMLVEPGERKDAYKDIRYLSPAEKEAAKLKIIKQLEHRVKEIDDEIGDLKKSREEIDSEIGELKNSREEIDSEIGELEKEQRDVAQKARDLGK